MFTPDLDLKVITRCSKFSIQDKTGVDVGAGTKWSGVSGLDPSTLTSATIRIVAPNGFYADHDVLSQIPTPVTDSWWFTAVNGTGVDGLHSLIYKLQTTTISITSYSDYSSTIDGTTRVYSVSHGLVTGMYIQITGTTNYDGEYYVTRIDANYFYITKDFLTDEAGTTAIKTYKSSFFPYVYCRSEAGIAKMFANLSRMTAGRARKDYLDDANTANGLLTALKSAISSSNISALDTIQAEISQILAFNNVDINL